MGEVAARAQSSGPTAEYVVMLRSASMPDSEPKSPRRWLWYSIGGAALVVVIGCAGLLGSYRMWHSRRQAQQREAAAAVVALGGTAQPSLSSTSPISVILERGNAPNLFMLNEMGLDDNDLKLFESAPTTKELSLFKNNVTDQGLAHLTNLHALETLDLRRNPGITDAGLVHLEGLTNLKRLHLIRTSVTPAGVSKLQQKLPNTKIAY